MTGVWRTYMYLGTYVARYTYARMAGGFGIFFRLAFVGFLPGHPESRWFNFAAFFGPSCILQRNAMANVEDIPFIVEDRRMLSRVAGDRSEFWGFGGLPC